LTVFLDQSAAVPESKVYPAFPLPDLTVDQGSDVACPASEADYHFPASTDLALGSASPARPDSKALPVLLTVVCPVLDECLEAQAAVEFLDDPALPGEAADAG
jgi:hypothetical protein